MKHIILLALTLASLANAQSIRKSTYGELYVHDGSTAVTVTTAGTYYLLSQLTTVGESRGMTVSGVTNAITVSKAGRYMYRGNFSFSGTGNSTYEIAVFTNNVEAINTDITRKLGAGGDVGAASASGILNLKAGDYLTVKATAGGNGDTITLVQGQVSLQEIP